MSTEGIEPQEPAEDQPMTQPGLAETPDLAAPVAMGPGEPAPDAASDDPDVSLLALVDRLTAVLEKSDLGELEVAAGGTRVILRAPSAIERHLAPAAAEAGPVADDGAAQPAAAGSEAAVPPATAPAGKPSVKAPLTGIFYSAPSPGATPYVALGDHVSVGQIIGLIEAMKLFNEIKSDQAGRVTKVCADSGTLVKAKQPLIEVEPS